MKKMLIVLFLIVTISYNVFAQTSVNIPEHFIGTWWLDDRMQIDTLTRLFFIIEITPDGKWHFGYLVSTYSCVDGWVNGEITLDEPGDIIVGTDFGIMLTLGEMRANILLFKENGVIVDLFENRWVNIQPQW